MVGGVGEKVGGMKEGKKREWEEGRRVRERKRGNKGGWKSYGEGDSQTQSHCNSSSSMLPLPFVPFYIT